MIQTDEQFKLAQAAIRNLQDVLLSARKTHGATDYKLLAEPILLELQRREQETLEYLSQSSPEKSTLDELGRRFARKIKAEPEAKSS